MQIDDCLSVNHLTGTETVGGFLMALSQTTALSKQYVTLKDATCGSSPACLPDQSGYGHVCSRVRGALIWGNVPMYQTTVFLSLSFLTASFHLIYLIQFKGGPGSRI